MPIGVPRNFGLIGIVLRNQKGIARIYGLERAMSGELLEFEDGSFGVAIISLEASNVSAVLLSDGFKISKGTRVRCTGKIAEISEVEVYLSQKNFAKRNYNHRTLMNSNSNSCNLNWFKLVRNLLIFCGTINFLFGGTKPAYAADEGLNRLPVSRLVNQISSKSSQNSSLKSKKFVMPREFAPGEIPEKIRSWKVEVKDSLKKSDKNLILQKIEEYNTNALLRSKQDEIFGESCALGVELLFQQIWDYRLSKLESRFYSVKLTLKNTKEDHDVGLRSLNSVTNSMMKRTFSPLATLQARDKINAYYKTRLPVRSKTRQPKRRHDRICTASERLGLTTRERERLAIWKHRRLAREFREDTCKLIKLEKEAKELSTLLNIKGNPLKLNDFLSSAKAEALGSLSEHLIENKFPSTSRELEFGTRKRK